MVIYADVYIILNFAIDFILMSVTAHFMKYDKNLLRISSACTAGSLLAFGTIFVSSESISLLSSVFIPIAMLLIAFGRKTLPQFVESYIILFGTAFVSAGIFKALQEKYIRLTPTMVFLIFLFIFIFCFLYFDIFSFKKDCRNVEIKVKSNDCEKSFNLLCDSGCLAKEPISGLPVILLSPQAYNSLYSIDAEHNTEYMIKNRIRLVPIKTASGSSIIEAVIPDSIVCKYNDKEIKCKAAIGKSEVNSFAGTDGIFPSSLLI